MGVTDFFRQFNALAWKNYKLKIRALNVMFLEILIPTAIICALAGLKSIITPVVIDQYVPSGILSTAVTENLNLQYNNMSCGSQNLVWRCAVRYRDMPSDTCSTIDGTQPAWINDANCQRSYIAVAPSDTASSDTVTEVNAFVTWANAQPDYEFTGQGLDLTDPFVLFSSESAFKSALDSADYSYSGNIYSSAIIFGSAADKAWDYTVRLNKTFVYYGSRYVNPETSTNQVLDTSLRSSMEYPEWNDGNGMPYHKTWNLNSYNTLVNIVDSYIATQACIDAGTCSSSDVVNVNHFGTIAYPNGEYETTGFWSAIGFIFSLLMIIVLLYPLANVISTLVKEKESKLREGMMMMSLTREALWASWWFNFIALFLPLSIILTAAGSLLFTYSSIWIIFSYFFVFFLSSTSYCIFVSNFFSNSRTAAIVGSLVFFGGFFIYVGMMSSNPSRSQILTACLHPAAAFTFGTLAFIEYEDTAIGVTEYTWNKSTDYDITFQDCLNMMFADTFILAVFAWYIEKIWPSEYGTQQPFYFFLLPSYWQACFGYKPERTEYNKANKDSTGGTEIKDVNVEVVSENLLQQFDTKECVDIQDLYKEFTTPQGGKKVAVDGLNLTMFSGQITALLGHNGAGKTTTIAMLTGLIPVDSGNAVIEGYDINENMHEIRQNLGVCPQHDILFAELTVEEHLVMFAAFKGVKGRAAIQDEVNKMINAVGLTEKRHVASKLLSGGQKRKLSVGIAFIGGSRVVFLDEPTSGMDPYSRRFTWNVIRQHREGRVIVLTTHFMDEADLLGDRIAIMGDGKLICCGSSLYLKGLYGVGYNMTLEKKDAHNFDSQMMSKLILNKVPGALLMTDVGTEMTWQLPFTSSGDFPSMFEYYDSNMDELGLESYGMSVTTLEEVFIKITRATHTAATAQAGRDAALASASGDGGSIKSLSTSSRTGNVDSNVEKTSDTHIDALYEANLGNNEEQQQQGESVPLKTNKVSPSPSESENDQGLISHTDKDGFHYAFKKVPEDHHFTYFLRHMKALLTKRAMYFIRDRKAWIFTYIVPFLFLFMGLLIMKYTYPSTYQPSLQMSRDLYNEGISSNYYPMAYSNQEDVNINVLMDDWNDEDGATYISYTNHYDRNSASITEGNSLRTNIANYASFPVSDSSSIVGDSTIIGEVSNVTQYLYDNREDYQASSVGSYMLLSTTTTLSSNAREFTYVTAMNYSAIFAAPVTNALLMEAFFKTFDSSYSLNVNFHPLPDTARQDELYSNYNQDLVVTFILLALPFVPAAFITFVVREREVKSKHQQMVSGVGVVAYWLSTFLWDNISFLITIFLFVVLIAGPVFGNDTKNLGGGGVDQHQELGIFFGLLFLFGGSMSSFTYLISFMFKQPAAAQVTMIFVCFILGMVLSIVGMVLRILGDTKDVYKDWVQIFLCIFPPFALGDGLHNMALINFWSQQENGGTPYEPNHWRITGMHMMMMAIETVVYLGATIAFELITTLPTVQKSLEVCNGPVPQTDESLKDEDVKVEENRIHQGGNIQDLAQENTILVSNLKKLYPGGKFAVKGITLGIPKGECFGLLGINGAGKSSTLAMLSGEFAPTEGAAFLGGLDLWTDIHACRRKIGYCPQFDALFELLTAREHLELYARIKGIAEEDIEHVVNTKISEMGLTEYADRFAGTYSGGNKRKLSVAIAMIGEPSIVFLDEPSTGMDPVARRFMWDVISDIVTKRESCSLILTTHSMEECEALCTRIGIMVGGVMRCLGSAQRLRTKYGRGYQIEIGMAVPNSTSISKECIQLKQLMTSNGQVAATDENDRETADMDTNVEATLSSEHINNHFDDIQLSQENILDIFNKLGKVEWRDRLKSDDNGADLVTALDSHGYVTLKHLASWTLLEIINDDISTFFTDTFGTFKVHERQPTKLRMEISADLVDGTRRPVSSIFKAIESQKTRLHIQEYAMAQTSLEQIFNHFAAQQEEETGKFGKGS